MKKSKRNIYQLTSYYPTHIGGMEVFVKKISELLSNEGHDVHVVTSSIGHHPEVVTQNKVRVAYLSSKELFNTPFSLQFYSYLNKAPKDCIFHLHVAQAFLPEIAALVASRKGVPLISHIHLDVGSTTFVGKVLLAPYKKFLLKKVLHASAKVIVQTEDYKKKIHELYNLPAEKLVVIPNGVTLQPVNKTFVKKLQTPYQLLFVGRLVNQKRVELLLEALQLLDNKNIPFQLHIVGDGTDRQLLEDLVKALHLTNKVIFHGMLNEKEVAKKYQNCHCVIQTSERESLSTVLLEALNYGCPIVATNIEGTRNLLTNRKDALLTSDDPVDISQQIEELLKNNTLRNQLISEGYKTIQKYSWDKVIKQIETVYTMVTPD